MAVSRAATPPGYVPNPYQVRASTAVVVTAFGTSGSCPESTTGGGLRLSEARRSWV
jgi:hypothetical protein